VPPRAYFPDRAATNAERQRRHYAAHRATSLKRIGKAPLTQQQMFDAAALQRPEQFGNWGYRLNKQSYREDAASPPDQEDTWIIDEAYQRTARWSHTDETTKKVLFKTGWRRVPVVRAASPVRHIPVTPELVRQALEALARLLRRGSCEQRARNYTLEAFARPAWSR
jgi:hypothetical protein